MLIRQVRPDEWSQLQQLNNEVFIDNAQYDPDLVNDWALTEAGESYFKELVVNPTKLCLVAESELGNLVGYLAASELEFDYRQSKYLEINNMGVVPSVRSQGVGRQLITECLAWAEAQGYQKLIVNSYFGNTKAVSFYKQNGFTEIDVSLERHVAYVENKPQLKPKKERFLFIVAVHIFLIRNDQVLLLERANSGYMDGWFSVPAGHVDGQETIWQAAQRELAEEVGVTITQEQSPSHVMHRMKENEERVDYFFIINDWPGEPVNAEPDKCAQVKWFELNHLPSNMVPYVRFALERLLAKKTFSEYVE
jgi:8-oxo-dGTP diphosphatase